jgi:hypothetical protein
MPEQKQKKKAADAFAEAMAEANAADAPMTITFHGIELVAGPPSKWVFPMQYHARSGNLVGMVEAVFGEDGLEKVIESGHTDLAEITALLSDLQGADQGNDPTPSS